jgi:hypothetical protein
LMMSVMARESAHMLAEMYTRETKKMVIDTGLASTLGIMGQDMKEAGARAICME